jgi:hypothetical protein
MVKRIVVSSPSPSPSPSVDEKPESQSFFPQGFPEVPRFSSLHNYLELCKPGVFIDCETLDAKITKRLDSCWDLPDEEKPLTAFEVVEKFRFTIIEDDSECNVDNIFIMVEPIDKVAIKREMVTEYENEDLEPLVGMKRAEIDITGDEPVETATFDGGMAVPEQVCFVIFESVRAPAASTADSSPCFSTGADSV